MIEEFGAEYVNRLHEKFPDMSGRSDYCVYWFRKIPQLIKRGGKSGVGWGRIRSDKRFPECPGWIILLQITG